MPSMQEAEMALATYSNPIELHESGHSAAVCLLPKSVRLVRRAGAPVSPEELCEFEVLTGNAAYQKGERFYLTQAQARQAYPAN